MMLLDVGVWLAAVWGRHAAHTAVRAWFDGQDADLAFCRVTQMSLLRLLSNDGIMRGDVLTRDDCWDVIDSLRADERVVHVEEPPQLEPLWRVLSARHDTAHKLWTDDYLAAFARAGDLTLVTLDHALSARHPSVDTVLIDG